jgi:outer membrane lipoprotein-sorting protein
MAPDIEPLTSGNVVLRGVPTAFSDQINEIVLEVTPESHIARLIIEGVDGATTEYRFANQKEDVNIADGRFNFKAPTGTEVVEGGLND